MPVRLKVHGGRSWIVAPDGSSAIARAKADRALVSALRTGHRVVDAIGAGVSTAKAPDSAYARQICRMAFLAPDIQRTILEGRQPPIFNLEGLVHGSIPLAWADQRKAFGF